MAARVVIKEDTRLGVPARVTKVICDHGGILDMSFSGEASPFTDSQVIVRMIRKLKSHFGCSCYEELLKRYEVSNEVY